MAARGRWGGNGYVARSVHSMSHGCEDGTPWISKNGDLRLDLEGRRDARDDGEGPAEEEAGKKQNGATGGEIVALAAS